jgi:FkbM family methyltransferase
VEPALQLIMGQSVTSAANDKEQVEPMVRVIEQQSVPRPEGLLADSGYCSEKDLSASGNGRPSLPIRSESGYMQTTLRPALTHIAHRFLQRATGCDILRYHPRYFCRLRRSRLIRTTGITCVVDIGANIGEYGRELREAGYSGRLVSFEPLSTAFQVLARRAAKDQPWECMRIALGSHDGTVSLNVAANLVSSSILPMLQAHSSAAPDSRYVGIEDAPMRSLDSLAPVLFRPQDSIWLKLDVQGFEQQVLDGAEQLLGSVEAIEVELSLQPLYEGQTLYLSMIDFLRHRGYALASVAPGFYDECTGRLLQFDGIFLREQSVAQRLNANFTITSG